VQNGVLLMRTISPYEALHENEYVVATKRKPRHIYGLYATEDEARRICSDLNKRYDEKYEVCAIDFGGAA